LDALAPIGRSLPDLHQVHRASRKAQMVIVNEAYHPTETSRRADVILPSAQFGEKAWTSTNSETHDRLQPELWDAPGEALPDWQIIAASPDHGPQEFRLRRTPVEVGTSSFK